MNTDLEMERMLYEAKKYVFFALQIVAFIGFFLRTLLPDWTMILIGAGIGSMFVHAMLWNAQEIQKMKGVLRDE